MNASSYQLFFWLFHRDQYMERLQMSMKPRGEWALFYHVYKIKLVPSVPKGKKRGGDNNQRKQGPNYNFFGWLPVHILPNLLQPCQWLPDFLNYLRARILKFLLNFFICRYFLFHIFKSNFLMITQLRAVSLDSFNPGHQ